MRVTQDHDLLGEQVKCSRNSQKLTFEVLFVGDKFAMLAFKSLVRTTSSGKTVVAFKAHNLNRQITVSNTPWIRSANNKGSP